MSDPVAQVPKEFNYAAFIQELAPLIAQAKAFDVRDRRQDGDAFRAWRHKVQDLIVKINRTHMDVNCALGQRQFRVLSYGSVSAKDQLNAFDRDLRDTLVELGRVNTTGACCGKPRILQTWRSPKRSSSRLNTACQRNVATSAYRT